MAVKQTAGRMQLGEFAPKFAALNDGGRMHSLWFQVKMEGTNNSRSTNAGLY